MSFPKSGPFVTLSLLLVSGSVASGQARALTSPAMTVADLRLRLFALAHDSMMGRMPGLEGNFKASAYVASEFARLGLKPAGEDGYFQTLPFVRLSVAPESELRIGTGVLKRDGDFVLLNVGGSPRPLDGVQAVFGGSATDSAQWISEDKVAGKLVIFSVPSGAGGKPKFARVFGVFGERRFQSAAGIAIAELEVTPPEMLANLTGESTVLDEKGPAQPAMLFITSQVAQDLLGADPAAVAVGAAGSMVQGTISINRRPVEFPARNVIAILQGSDSSLRGQYVSLSAHSDHVGFNHSPVDHDSIRAHNRIVRPMGADSPDVPATPEQESRIQKLLAQLRRQHGQRPDSITNGADDDGTGTVALLEIAERMATSRNRPKRSILFISHTAEELGLLGSAWFTDHPTVPIDSLVAEIDMDMVGRGTKSDLPEGGPAYLEVIGSKRVSKEFGQVLEEVNAKQPSPFRFNYAYDVPGHPLQYYCRADHYNYARYNIPAVSLSRGEHLDYHQVTDEAQYIDYPDMLRVAKLVSEAVVHLANLNHRPQLDHPRGDPHARCVQ